MKKLSMDEQIEVAISLAGMGMPIEKLIYLGIDISKFPPSAQAKIHKLSAEHSLNTFYSQTLKKGDKNNLQTKDENLQTEEKNEINEKDI